MITGRRVAVVLAVLGLSLAGILAWAATGPPAAQFRYAAGAWLCAAIIVFGLLSHRKGSP